VQTHLERWRAARRPHRDDDPAAPRIAALVEDRTGKPAASPAAAGDRSRAGTSRRVRRPVPRRRSRRRTTLAAHDSSAGDPAATGRRARRRIVDVVDPHEPSRAQFACLGSFPGVPESNGDTRYGVQPILPAARPDRRCRGHRADQVAEACSPSTTSPRPRSIPLRRRPPAALPQLRRAGGSWAGKTRS